MNFSYAFLLHIGEQFILSCKKAGNNG